MGKLAFLFAGQAAQYPGMGKELWEDSPAAKQVFAMAESLRPGTLSQCFTATAEVLSQTENTQPCLYCVDLAAAEALREAGIQPDALAGFSLGEVAALTFAGAFTAEDGFRFVCRRANLMETAAKQEKSGMVAVLKLSNSQVETLCHSYIKMYPVNYNCPGQIVVAGSQSQLPAFCAEVKAQGGRALPLAVSAGFHSPFMDFAAQGLAREIREYHLKEPKIPVYANRTAAPYGGEACQREELLTKQVVSPVRWEETIRRLVGEGFDRFIEVGPGKTLSGFLKKIAPEAVSYQLEDRASLQSTLAALQSTESALPKKE